MTELHKQINENDASKLWWIMRAVSYIRTKCYDLSFEVAYKMCESLYTDYVEQGDIECTPEYAVDKDMSYWD